MNSTKANKKQLNKNKGVLYYMNPLHLVADINGYGYDYSIKTVIVSYVVAIVAAVATGLLYKLNIFQMIILGLIAIIATPFLIANSFKSTYQQKRFSEVSSYIEKMLYYFKSSKKIIIALEDMQRLFPTGEMREAIDDAIDHIRTAVSNEDITAEALEMISNKYPCERIRTMHGFLLSVESKGGESDTAIDLLLKDKELWESRVKDTQKRKAAVKTNILISVVLTMLLCVAIIYLPTMVAGNLNLPDISQYGLVSWSAVALLCILLVLYVKADGKLCVDWLDEDDAWDEEKAEKEYDKIVEYNPAAGMRESLMWALGALILTVILLLFIRNFLVAILGCILVIFMLNQHTIGYNLAKKNVTKAIEKAFPTWLMSVSLYLQNENVRVSIRKSYHNAPAILKPALADFLEAIDENPDSEVPYNTFLKDFELPEVSDSMSTLYSLACGAGGNAETEFKNIINRIMKMTDRAEEIKNDDKVAVMGLYITAPSLVGAVKLIIDMTALLFAFFSMAG